METMNKVKAQPIQPNDEKLKDLILFIAQRSEGDKKFGATKLNKILFFADFYAYLFFGKPITGQEYHALEHGPAPRRVMPARDELRKSGAIAIRKQNVFGKEQERIFALADPDLDAFSAPEIQLVEAVIEQLKDMNARDSSDLSHTFVGYELAKLGETIPYQVALVGDRKPTGAERKRGLELADYAKELLAKHAN